MQIRFIGAIILAFIVQVAFGQSRELVDFNQGWAFILDDDLSYRHEDYQPVGWQEVNLPHDWSIGFDFDEEYPAGNAGGALPGGVGWYRKTFTLDKGDENKEIHVLFGGAQRYTEVWINGHYIGKHINGYLSFEKELTAHLNPAGQPNTIAVRVDNSLQPNSRWYTGAGIYRKVFLEKRNPVHLIKEETFITTPKAKAALSELHIASQVAGKHGDLTASITLLDENGQSVFSKDQALTQGELDFTAKVKNVKLWDVDNPYLYNLTITLKDASGRQIDALSYRLGFRDFNFDVQKGFFLNDQYMKIHGVCMHHDLGLLGASFNKSAAKRQLLIMKEMGVNAIRTAHNPPAKELLDLCDELGLLVYNEAYDMWRLKKNKYDYHIDFKEHHISDLENFIKRDRNHTSVFMWSIGNEIREQFDSTGVDLTKNMSQVVKTIDPTRPVTVALTETNYDKNFIAQAESLDVLGFNYKYFDYDKLPKEFKNYPLLASETTSALQTRGVYDALHDTIQLWPASSKDKYVTNGNDDYTVSAYDNVAAYWGTSHERAWIEVKKRDFLSGIFVWTGFDYLGEPVPYPYPARSSYYGIVDLAGLPKDVYYMYQSEWTDKEVLHVLPHWNWNEGEQVDVWCYYNNADEVELFINGESYGKAKKNPEQLHAKWQVPFQAGELKVVKYKDGQPLQETSKFTAGSPVDIQVALESEKYATGQEDDLVFATFSLVDKDGNTVPHEDLKISLEELENIEVLGTDNGYQADLNSLSKPERETYKGLAVAFLRKKDSSKPAKVQLNSKLGKKTIAIQ